MKENNINKILKDDGVDQSKIDINEFVNLNSVSLEKIKRNLVKLPGHQELHLMIDLEQF